ncbi:MAG TPA: YihY/virulence factor BrkB family protein [Longimicrobiales bacterium]|nr:YihY/virulence factor BrkB family protein [Longimicrobiales bacterium]
MTEGRIARWTGQHPLRVAGISTSRLAVRVVKQFLDVRVMGLAAEMTYYALLSLFPLVGALGASLGFAERLFGPAQALAMEAAIIRSLQLVFSPDVSSDVMVPLVQGLLQEERTGFALGGFAVTIFFASRVFRSAIDTLDTAYNVDERRGTIKLWWLGFVFAVSAVVVAAVVLAMVVVGPLLGGARALAIWLRLGNAFEWAWHIARWPVVFALATGFLSMLYRFGPNVRNTWREALPGAVIGMLLLLLVAIGFRVYIGTIGVGSPAMSDADEAVLFALQAFGALLAVLLWLWLSAMVILTGGVINAELSRIRGEMPPQKEV